MTHEEAMREGAAKIAREYADPPEGGALVPRAWVKENMPFAAAGSFEASGAFDIEWASEADVASFFEAMTRPAPGYREIANADGIRWHERIEDDV